MEDVNTKQKLFRKMYANTCPECGHDNLALVENEWSVNRLNDQGFINDSRTETISILQCLNCTAKFPVEKVGMSYRVKSDLPPIRKVMKDFNPFQN